ncbi:dihydropteroate synthase [Enterovirga sp.]|uniref:dihydropteroate synthase n=1 Tax=Enterovirga sp. TaxID=2026350 RepID=UPI002C99168B|nr:dihydropteroate synthase [Enterovirga sp.]HMO29734.1 dihydropteroate synthase [Enterovirga sp.]
MGVLNVTPDSFSDGGRFDALPAALAQARRMVSEGADILDIGGESTRPGHAPVPAEQEQARILPAIRALAPAIGVPVSVDTWKAATAEAALRAGGRIVNDIWGLQRDPDIASVAAAHGAGVVAMHNRESADASLDILDEMKRFFERTLAIARRAGIPDGHVMLDPGIGFGKTPDQQLDALRRLPDLCALGFPVLVGASRKSVLGRLAPRETRPDERLIPSIAAHVIAAQLGAAAVRVHDVAAHREALRVVEAVRAGSVARP